MGEIWIRLEMFPPYEVSTFGRIRRDGKIRKLLGGKASRGWARYPTVNMSVWGSIYTRYVHHLVLQAFVGPRPPKLEARHLNDDPNDCRLSNLVWGTSKENAEDRVRNGNTSKGEAHSLRCPQHKNHLSDETIRQIRSAPGTVRAVAKAFGISASYVSYLRNNRYRKSGDE